MDGRSNFSRLRGYFIMKFQNKLAPNPQISGAQESNQSKCILNKIYH